MAHFRGTVKGGIGEASRLGTKNSGLVVEANGWNDGVRVEATFENGKNVFRIYKTGGSTNSTGILVKTIIGGE